MTPGIPPNFVLFSSLNSPVLPPFGPLSTPQPTSTLTFSDAPLRIGILEVFRLGLGQRDCNFRQVGQTPLTGFAWVLAPATRLNQACGQLEKRLPGRPTPPCTDTVDDF